MSPCQPLSSNAIFPPSNSGTGGFAPQTPAINNPFPPLPFEDLGEVFDQLSLIIPPGTLKPPLSSNFDKDILDGISHLLKLFTPFFMTYTFFLPVLNLLVCIIEVICSIPNPFKLISTITRLFRVCIPEFLALFPIFALPIMIASLLLLVLTFIIYIIQRLLTIIGLIIDNVNTLSQAATRLDNDSILSITKKIGDLLCLLQNLFVVLGVITIIIQAIESILKLSFSIPPCDDSNSDGCCTADVCPAFIKNNTTIDGYGSLQYFNTVGLDSGIVLPPTFPSIFSPLRNESWQFYDASLTGTQKFDNITHASDLPAGNKTIFFPTTKTFTKDTPSDQAPYTIDFRFFYNPILFGRTDILGARYLRVKGCIVSAPPVDGVLDYKNNLQYPFNGTLAIVGGTAYEDDGQTTMKISPSDSSPASLNTLIHFDPNISLFPTLNPTDGYLYTNVSYTFNINHGILLGDSLITTGCVPSISQNKNIINSTIANIPPLDITLPDINATQQCLLNAINKFKKSISVQSAQQLQTDITSCLNNLATDVSASIIQAILAGYNQYKSTFTIDPAIQFTTYPIKVVVHLNDNNGNSLTNNLPPNIASQLIPKLKADITLGKIDKFVYDGYQYFTANITSDKPGNGKIKISFDNKYISIFNNPTNLNQLPSISITELTYTFVLSSPLVNIARRDERDVSNEA